jgi:hypothetical protein
VASAIAGVVLLAGWGWCWTTTRSCADGADWLDVNSTIAFVERLTTSELRSAVCLVQAPQVACTQTGIGFVVPSDDGLTVDLVTYLWDRDRGVVWRKAPGSHLAEDVAAFSIAYYAAGDRLLSLRADGALAAADVPSVRRVVFSIEVASGRASAGASWQVCLRGAT